MGSQRSRDSNSLIAFRKGFKREGEGQGCRVCDQPVGILLMGCWDGDWESTLSTFWFQPVWVLHACGQHAVNFFHLGGLSVPAKQLKNVAQTSIYGP